MTYADYMMVIAERMVAHLKEKGIPIEDPRSEIAMDVVTASELATLDRMYPSGMWVLWMKGYCYGRLATKPTTEPPNETESQITI